MAIHNIHHHVRLRDVRSFLPQVLFRVPSPLGFVRYEYSLVRRRSLFFVVNISKAVDALNKCLHGSFRRSSRSSFPGGTSPSNLIPYQCLTQDFDQRSITRKE